MTMPTVEDFENGKVDLDDLSDVLEKDSGQIVTRGGKTRATIGEINEQFSSQIARLNNLMSAYTYGDTAEGIAKTVEGDYFSVISSSNLEFLDMFEHGVGGVAVLKATYPSIEAVKDALPLPMNSRIGDSIHRKGFETDGFDGLFVTNDLVTKPSYNLTVNSAKNLVIDGSGSTTTSPCAGWMGHVRDSSQTTKVIIEIETDASDTRNLSFGCFLCFGDDPATLQTVYYQNNGRLAAMDSAENVVGVGRTVDGMTFNKGDKVSMEVTVYGNGEGFITAVNSNGETASNPISGIPEGKIWFCWKRPLNGKISKFQVITRGDIEKPDNLVISEFNSSNALGAYLSVNDVIGSGSKFNFTGGSLNIANFTSSEIGCFDMGVKRGVSEAVEIETKGSVSGTSPLGCGLIIGIGEPLSVNSDRVFFTYLRNGFIAMWNNNTLVEGGYHTHMIYNINEEVQLSVIVDNSNVAIVKATKADGTSQTVTFNNVPHGKIWLGWRTSNSSGKYTYFRKYVLSDALINVVKTFATLGQVADLYSKPRLLRAISLADSEVNREPGGFTCTGLDKLTRGKWAGCWVVGDDGRKVALDGTPNVPAIHILTPDFTRILFTINGGWDNSLQGVAVDTIGTDDTIWCNGATDNKIRRYVIYGDNAGNEIISDRIVPSTLGLVADGSALAFDKNSGGRGALWYCSPSSKSASLINCDPNSSPRVMKTITLAQVPDQFHYDADRKYLYYANGNNGANGWVRLYNLNTDTDELVYDDLELAQAMEGIYIDERNSLLTVVSDGGFHFEATPELNLALTYSVPIK